MEILMIILGIIMVLCGISCVFTPLLTFISAGYLIIALLIVYGVAGIVKAFATKQYGISFIFNILSVVLGLIIAFVPGLKLRTDGALITIMAIWLLLQGVLAIVLSIKFRGVQGGNKWIAALILGIIGVILGLYSLFHPIVLAFTIGMLIGFYFIESGINLIFLS